MTSTASASRTSAPARGSTLGTPRRPPRGPVGPGRPAPPGPGRPGLAGRPGTAPPGRRDPRRPPVSVLVRRPTREQLPRYWFAERLLLTLSGRRPLHTLMRHTLPAAYDHLADLAPAAPLRPVSPRAPLPVLRHCDEFRPRADVIEAFARITCGDRLRALAFRLEAGATPRWLCAAVEVDGIR